ncbi:LCP family protein [Paenibacillus motobuensis]|uniref:LCP family protein n=1 Tax=Paenibacillus TaxID=44249 RepID=UPI00203A8444|nr:MULTISPECIES: LCP family protein [Paenibacillus]MCM3041337.1 LCP family protein [Paenibacillus lutimineralis]MCM3648441.1 LCP family protein [Paenibacillus motobuensis]
MLERKQHLKNKAKSKGKKRKNKGKRALIVVAVLLLLGTGGYIFRKELSVVAFDMFLSGQVEKKLEKSYAPVEEQEPQQVPVEEKFKPFSMLLLGVDQRDNEPARSDTMIYAVVRPEESRVLLVSIPRDTYTEIVGRGKEDKINHAYAFGGAKMAKDTVTGLLDHPVDYYAAINFHGLRDIVDALGGVELPITKDIVNKQKDHEKFTIKANKPLYNGQEALNYVRYREDSDFNRTGRHQIFLNAIVNRMMKLDQVSKIPDLMDMMGENFKTDMMPSYIIDLSKQVLLGESPTIKGFTIMGEGFRKNGVYYDSVDKEDLEFAKQMIDSWSNPDTKPEDLLTPESRDQQDSTATTKE